MKSYVILLLTLLSCFSYAASMTKAEYKHAVKEQRSNYPIDQGNGTSLTDSYMEGDTNIIITQLYNLEKSDIQQSDIDQMKTRLTDFLAPTYCGVTGIESQIRKAGVDIEYRFVDKNKEQVWAYTASERACQSIHSQSEIKNLQAGVEKASSQIEKLVKFGKGRVTICNLRNNSKTVKVGFANELEQPYIFVSAIGEHAVNIVHIYLTRNDIHSLLNITNKAINDSSNLKDIEKVELARFSSKGGSMHFVSQFGEIRTFFSADDSVDSVLSKPDLTQMNFCLNEGEKFLEIN